MVSKMGESCAVDENLLRPYGGGKFAKNNFSLKALKTDETGFISVHPLKSAAILLIFDALTFNSRSRPWVIEFDEDITIPYSVHSYSHQFGFKDLTETERKEAEKEMGKMMKKGEERFMDIYQSVLLRSNKTFKWPTPKKSYSFSSKEYKKDVFDFVNEEAQEVSEEKNENVPEEKKENINLNS